MKDRILVFSITAILSLFAIHPSSAQNLVLNPGFEDSLKCPSGSGAFTNFVAVWTKPTYGSADYFFTGCPVAPANEPPHNGNAYAGIIVYDPANYREYITGTLASPLLPGATYEVSFYISLLDNCLNGISEVGAWLTPTLPNFPGINPILTTPQFQHTMPLIADSGWTQLKGYVQAAGGEQYITIGAFIPDSQLTFTPAPGVNSWFDVYYFIDDVAVTRDSVTAILPGDQPENQLAIYPNPATRTAFIRAPEGQRLRLLLFDPSGRVIHSQPVSGPAPLQLPGRYAGLFFFQFLKENLPVKTGKLMLTGGQ